MRVVVPVTQNYFEWLGGLNYLRTLVSAVDEHGSGEIQPILLAPERRPPDALNGFPPELRIESSALLDVGRPAWVARTARARATGTDAGLDRVVRGLGADLLSHHDPLGRGAHTPTLAWIPDVQHRRLPELFSRRQHRERDRQLARIDRYAAGVVVSSEAGRADLAAAIPGASDRIHVLRFVPDIGADASETDVRAARDEHGLTGRYLYLPNQMWVHKNHRVVVEAMGRLRREGAAVTVVTTGDTADPRSPGLAGELSARAAELGVQDDLRVLGRVPYANVKALMAGAVAVVNPSLFEGWSTTVEEARALGKRTVLSDIDVHREQDLPAALYADPRDAEAFAAALAQAWDEEDESAETARRAAAHAQHPARRRAFARRYEDICLGLNR